MHDARLALDRLRAAIDTIAITATNYKPVYKYWLHLLACIRVAEGRNDEAALYGLQGIKEKLGYWSTPFDRAFFLDQIGLLYQEMNRIADAEKAFRESLAYNPHYGPARFHLARLLYSSKQYSDARREAELFLREWQSAEEDAAELAAARKVAARPMSRDDRAVPRHEPQGAKREIPTNGRLPTIWRG